MKLPKQTISIAIAVALIATIAAVASAAISNSPPNPNFVTADDAAISGSEDFVAETTDKAKNARWALRQYHNKRGQRCLDGGQLVNGKLVRKTPEGVQTVLAGQGGVCGPSDQRNQIAVFAAKTNDSDKYLVSGIVEPNVEKLLVNETSGQTTSLSPTGKDRSVFGAFDGEALPIKTTGDEIVKAMEERQKSDRPGPGGLSLTLVFKDGSELSLFEKNFREPAQNSMAGAAYRALNSPTGK